MALDEIQVLKARKEAVEQSISKLAQQRDVLEIQIREVIAERTAAGGNVTITRRNRHKMYVYGLIREIIRQERRDDLKGGLRTKILFDEVKKNDHQILYNTFRSFLYRLKKNGKLIHNNILHTWDLPENDRVIHSSV